MSTPLILLAVVVVLGRAAVCYRRERAAWRAAETRWADEWIADMRRSS